MLVAVQYFSQLYNIACYEILPCSDPVSLGHMNGVEDVIQWPVSLVIGVFVGLVYLTLFTWRSPVCRMIYSF